MDFRETSIEKNYVYRGKILQVRRDEVALPGGRTGVREVVEHRGAVCILCMKEGKIALVRQFRYAVGESLWELPAGKLERGEEPLRAAFRELAEETGLEASDMELLFAMYPTPGYSDETIYIYEAKGAAAGESHPDEDEFLDVCFFPFEKACSMIADGTIKDGKTIAALLYFKNKNHL